MNEDQMWALIDAALIRMRRFLDSPSEARGQVDLSAVLIVDTIARRRSSGERTRVVDVATSLSVKPSTASRLVASAESAGYVSRTRGEEDPRSVALALTPSGITLDETAKEYRIALLKSSVSRWDAATVTTFAQLLDEFSRLAQGQADPGVVDDGPHF